MTGVLPSDIEMTKEPAGSTPEDFAKVVRNDVVKWTKVFRSRNMGGQ